MDLEVSSKKSFMDICSYHRCYVWNNICIFLFQPNFFEWKFGIKCLWYILTPSIKYLKLSSLLLMLLTTQICYTILQKCLQFPLPFQPVRTKGYWLKVKYCIAVVSQGHQVEMCYNCCKLIVGNWILAVTC